MILGIQARSSSKRLPNKAHLQIGGKTLLQWVLDSCQIASRFLRNENQRLDASIMVCILTPKNDPIASLYKTQVPIVEGDENDVLSRYVSAANQFSADHIVRITADCIWIPPHHITKHVKAALLKDRDYTTNIMYRTYKEGWDCEVLSRRLLDWLNENAKSSEDRQHVTTLLSKEAFPFRYIDGKPSICHIINFYDESHIKTSIDTKEEYEDAEKAFQRYQKARVGAKRNGTYLT